MTKPSLKTLTPIIVQGLWLSLPAITTAPIFALLILSIISRAIEPTTLLIALVAVLQTGVLFILHRQGKSLKHLWKTTVLGWCIQWLAIAVCWSIGDRGPIWATLLITLWITLAFVLGQLIATLTYLGLAKIGRARQRAFFRTDRFPLIGTLTLLATLLLAINAFYIPLLLHRQALTGKTDSTYDLSAVPFRAEEKAKTQLGRLPRPLKIFQTPTGYVGLTLNNEQIPLSFLDVLGTEPIEQSFFDIYTDKVYVMRRETTHQFDLTTQASTTLPATLQSALQERIGHPDIGTTSTRTMIAVHQSSMALMMDGMGGTGNISVYNTQTGERTFESNYLGYDGSRIYHFWINGKGYRLFLDGQDPMERRAEKRSGTYPHIGPSAAATLYMYLEEYDQPVHILTDNEVMEGIGKVVFGNSDWFVKDKVPLVELTTSYPKERYGKSRFSVRELYLLADGRIALEIENMLIMINLANRQVESTADASMIATFLASARLLSADDENAYHFINSCGSNAYSEAFAKNIENKFLFCLK